jgi:hypothetical protein
MKIASLIAGAVVALGMAVSAAPSQAAQIAPPHVTIQSENLAQPVHYRRHFHRHPGIYLRFGDYGYRRHNSCHFWRNECADRWGWGTWRYRRCVRNHGC